jgi:hypothetical protein
VPYISVGGSDCINYETAGKLSRNRFSSKYKIVMLQVFCQMGKGMFFLRVGKQAQIPILPRHHWSAGPALV